MERMAKPGHRDADEREDTELERLETARKAKLLPASPVRGREEAAHPPGYHAPGPEVRREPRAPGEPGKK
jgi:hypothetical protein